MAIIKALKASPNKLAMFLLTLGSFYLLVKLLGYTFVSANRLIADSITAMIIIYLTINEAISENEKTKAVMIFHAFLPLIAILFFIIKGIATNASIVYTYIYIVHSSITLLCSLILFYLYGPKKFVKIGVGILYIIILTPIFLIFFLMFIFATVDFGENTVITSEISPNSKYLAEIVDSDQGALGGATFVTVTRQNRDINIFIGEFKKDAKEIYSGRWGEFETMTLRWETDEILYVNEKRYDIR